MHPNRRSLAVAAAAAGVAAASSQGQAQTTATGASQAPRLVHDQLTPENSVLLLVDFQPQFVFSTRSTPVDALVNNAVALAKAARLFNVPTVVSTIAAKAFAGPLLADLQAVNPSSAPLDRTVINAWSDPRVREAIKATGCKKLLIAGLWTDNCVMLPALSALAEGHEVYAVADASGDYDAAAHDLAMLRLVQAGAVPITWLPVMLEWLADWSQAEAAAGVSRIMAEHAKAVGVGAQYLGAVKG